MTVSLSYKAMGIYPCCPGHDMLNDGRNAGRDKDRWRRLIRRKESQQWKAEAKLEADRKGWKNFD